MHIHSSQWSMACASSGRWAWLSRRCFQKVRQRCIIMNYEWILAKTEFPRQTSCHTTFGNSCRTDFHPKNHINGYFLFPLRSDPIEHSNKCIRRVLNSVRMNWSICSMEASANEKYTLHCVTGKGKWNGIENMKCFTRNTCTRRWMVIKPWLVSPTMFIIFTVQTECESVEGTHVVQYHNYCPMYSRKNGKCKMLWFHYNSCQNSNYIK